MKIMKKIVALMAVALLLCSMLPMAVLAADTTIVFELGANGAAGHKDGSSASDYTETVGDYTLNITGGTKMYTGALDEKGNSCIKLGTSSVVGGFSFTVPDDVTSVIIAVGKYKANTTKLNINGTAYTLTKNSNDGAYDEIVIDTTSNKTITLSTVSGGVRAMVNSITYVIAETGSADCDHASLKCGETCSACGEYTKEHKYTNNCVAECENGCGTANPNYADHVYGGIYDAECDVCFAKREVNMPAADSELTIAEAIALGVGVGNNCYTEGKYYVTGEITEVYNTTYGNLYITDGENTFTVYGLYDGNGNRYDAMAEKPEAGMTIKVYGPIGNYNGTAQMKNGDLIEATGDCEHAYEFECSTVCSLCGYGEREAVCVTDAEFACVDGLCIYCGNDVDALEHDFDDEWDPDCNYGCGHTREVEERPAISEHTIQFDSGKTQRTEFSTTKQVWSDGTLTFINNKAASSSAVADYSNPVRLYASSEIVIECGGMTEIVFDCNSSSYATALKNSIGDAATVDGDKVTVAFDESVDSFTVAKLTAQVRMDSITVTAVRKGDADCAHEWSEATCTEPATCALCGAVDGEALGHDWEIISQENATCTNAGSIVYECAACGEDKVETFPILLHTYVDGICSGCGAELPLESTITFDADKTQRIEFGNESQKWANTGLVLVNNKGSYNQNLGDYSNPLRMYKGTEIIISFPGMTSLVIDGPASADYAWDDTLAGYTFTKADGVYTITFAEPTDSITLTAANQVRANSITATRVEEVACQHEYDNACDVDCNLCYEPREVSHNVIHVEAKEATCATNGNIEYWFCDVCGFAWLDAECTLNTNLRAVVLPATGEHTYDDEYDADCNVCGEVREVPEKPVETVYGDANGDGEIDARDIALLQQYNAGWEVELNEVAADANGDGEIDARDIALLQQYNAGWDVTLGPADDENKLFNDGELGEW